MMRAKLVNKEYKKNGSTGSADLRCAEKDGGRKNRGEAETRGEMEQETADSLHTKNSQEPLQ